MSSNAGPATRLAGSRGGAGSPPTTSADGRGRPTRGSPVVVRGSSVMGRTRRACRAAAFVILAAGPGTALAQPGPMLGPPPLTRSASPTTSPYLNLAIGDDGRGDPALRYYRLVRPENEFRRANARQGGEIRSLEEQFAQQRRMLQSPDSALGPTGHRTGFMNYGSYFPGARTGRRR